MSPPLTPEEEDELRRLAAMAPEDLSALSAISRARLGELARRYLAERPNNSDTEEWSAELRATLGRPDLPVPQPHQRASDGGSPLSHERKSPNPTRWLASVGFGLAVLGSVGPWVTVSALGGLLTKSVWGTEGDGKLTLLAALAGLVITLVASGFGARVSGLVLGLGIGVVAGINMADLSSVAGDATERTPAAAIQVGWGLVLTLVAAAVAAGGSMLDLWPRPSTTARK